MDKQIANMYKLQKEKLELEKECNKIGKGIFGDSYECCYLDKDTGILEVYEDCGHEYESDIYQYNSKGEEIE